MMKDDDGCNGRKKILIFDGYILETRTIARCSRAGMSVPIAISGDDPSRKLKHDHVCAISRAENPKM
jgi:hypothetical protein